MYIFRTEIEHNIYGLVLNIDFLGQITLKK